MIMGMVFKSSNRFQLSIHTISNRIHISNGNALPPLICQEHVNPGRMKNCL